MHYMDQFQSVEAYLLRQICANKGTQNCLHRQKLKRLAEENGVLRQDTAPKKEMAKALLDKMGAAWLAAQCEHFGVSSYCFQQKFGITNEDVKALERSGFLRVTGGEQYEVIGTYQYANLYDAFLFFQLKEEDVIARLQEK